MYRLSISVFHLGTFTYHIQNFSGIYVIFLLVLYLHTSHTYVIPFLPHFHPKKSFECATGKKGKILYQHKTYTQKGDEILEIQQIVFFPTLKFVKKNCVEPFFVLVFHACVIAASFLRNKVVRFFSFPSKRFFGVSFLFWEHF